MRRVDRTDQGFTLVEVLVALVMSALLLSIISTALLTARSRDTLARDRSAAMLLAEARLAERADGAFVPGETAAREQGVELIFSEEALAEDPRRFFVLSAMRVEARSAKGMLLYSATLRRIKALPPT